MKSFFERRIFRQIRFYLAIILPLTYLLASCGDYSADGETSHSMDLQFAFTADDGATKGASGDNDVADFTVYRLDVFAITASSGIITGKATMDFPGGIDMRSSNTQIVNITVPQGSTEFAVIANASDATDIAKIGQVLTKNQLMAFVADKSTSNTQLMMSGISAAINTTVANPSINIALTRTVSRIQLFLNKDASIPEEIKITGVTVKNAASKSNVFLGATSSGPYSDVTVGVSNAVVPTGSVPANGLFITEVPVYENLQGVANQTYLEITGTYAGVPTTYQVYLNNTNTAVTSPLNRNTIYRIYGTIIGVGNMQGIKVGINILPWTERNYSIDVSQTRIEVGKTKLEISSTDVIPVTTNATSISVRSDAAWLTATATAVTSGSSSVSVSASTIDYMAPRTANLYVTANNVTKVIAVTQRPDQGTITAPASFWVSPSTGNDTRTITIKSTGAWTFVNTPTNVTADITSGSSGNTDIKFTRNFNPIDNGDYTIYGDQDILIKNTETLETITVTAKNLFLLVDDLDVPNNTGTNTKENVNSVRCFGASASCTVTGKSAWITSATINGGNITLVAQGDPDGEIREGTVTFKHNDDPNYIVVAKVVQDFLVTIPPFDYFVIKYTWLTSSGGDVDIDVRFRDNGPNATFDNQGVGFSNSSNTIYPPMRNSQVYYNYDPLLQWGGDATVGQGETVFFNPPLLENQNSLPRFITLDCRAIWWSGSQGAPVRTTIFAYKGGVMEKGPINGTLTGNGDTETNDRNFYNITNIDEYYLGENGKFGLPLYTSSRQQALYGSQMTAYTQLVVVVYDRVKHSAVITYPATELNTPAIGVPTRSSGGQSVKKISEAEIQRSLKEKEKYK